ncbi:helicase RepA family protein [Vibrio sp. JC009]|uniref:AAA family ATPase n=1 Tax=Vibrio sp. JC009 TaxID=2912314 RepID=UPI0023B1B046|nr:AAA family ATPase [Vibrio sp. JC009]WED21485.1 helicase RepA family protein [Vibrio sp. JC009]
MIKSILHFLSGAKRPEKEGKEVVEVIYQTPPERRSVSKISRSFEIERLDHIKVTRGSCGYDQVSSWLVKEVIPDISFGVVYGASGSFKSFYILNLACSLAKGMDFLGCKTSKGAVVYVAGEGARGASRRVRAWEIHYQTKASDVYIINSSLVPTRDGDRNFLLRTIRDIENKDGVKVKLVIFDTLARCFEGEENNSSDMGAFVQACDYIKSEAELCVLAVHHIGKNAASEARGHSSLNGSCDFELKIARKKKEDSLEVINTKQKDEKEKENLHVELESMNLGVFDEDGIELSSLVLRNFHQSNDLEKYDAKLIEIIEGFGGRATRKQLRDKYYESTEGGSKNANAKRLSRALNSLVEGGIFALTKSEQSMHLDTFSLSEKKYN